MGKDSVAVRIAGHEYKIRSDGDVDALREIASYVDRAMARVRERTGTVDTLDVAVLTCLNLAREIMALHEEQVPAGSTAVAENKLRSLIERVETSLGRASAISEEVSEAASDAGHADGASETGTSLEAPRTLDLPGVEALRDRTAARNHEIEAAAAAEEAVPEARVAAGGRERAS
jgi:cell division protein ZapA (FtsZ GTPase activity inhibitor)